MRSALALSLVVLVAMAPSAARAQSRRLPQAIQAYESFEYERALVVLQAARAEPNLDATTRARIEVYFGLTHFELGRADEGSRDLARALDLDPSIELPADTSPKILARFTALRAERAIATSPPPAEPPHETVPMTTAPERRWTWVAAGASVAALAGATTFLVLAKSSNSAIASATSYDDANTLADRATSRQTVSTALFTTAAVSAAVAVILYVVEGRPPGEARAAATPDGLALVRF